jgi:hypothetical protein
MDAKRTDLNRRYIERQFRREGAAAGPQLRVFLEMRRKRAHLVIRKSDGAWTSFSMGVSEWRKFRAYLETLRDLEPESDVVLTEKGRAALAKGGL